MAGKLYYSAKMVEGRRFQIDLSGSPGQHDNYVSLIWRRVEFGLRLGIEASADSTVRLAQVGEIAASLMRDIGNDLEQIVERVKAEGLAVYWHQPLKCWRLVLNYDPALKTWRYVSGPGEEYKVLAADVGAAKVEIVKLAAADDDDQGIEGLLDGEEPEEIEWNNTWEPVAIDLLYERFIDSLDFAV